VIINKLLSKKILYMYDVGLGWDS